MSTETKRRAAAILISLGVILVMSAIWGGSYVLHQLSFDDWRSPPALMTILAVGVLGMALCAAGAMKLDVSL